MPDTCFTEQQVQDISYTLDSLYQLNEINDSIISEQKIIITKLHQLIELDSMQLNYKTQQVNLLKTNINLYIEREKQLAPKWYDNKIIWFSTGIITTMLIFQIAK